MNNTLTGLGVALVLALVAALIGPWFVNWSAYRDGFAREASALVGAPVKMSGAIDVRLLPTPYARLRGLTAGSGASALAVEEIELELAVAPLLRGELKAERAKLLRPRFGVEIAADGAARTAFSGKGGGGPADRVSLDRVEIVDGTVAVAAPSGRFTLDHVSGLAEVGSLAGPFRFEGVAGGDGARIQARLSTTRIDERGAMRLKLALQRDGRPETIDLDGGLVVGAKPAFDGRVTLVGPAAKGDGAAPWRAVAEVKATPARVGASNIDVAYGPEDRAIRFSGRGESTLGAKPRIDLALESRQVDLDRFLGDGRPKTPAGVIRAVAERLGGAPGLAVEGGLSLDARGLVLGGDVAQDVSVELASEAGGWRVRKASARLPGGAALAARGALAFVNADPGFSGDVDVSVADLAAFRRWLAGGEELGGPVRRLSMKGRVSAGLAAVSISNATLVADGARTTGDVSWRQGEPGERDRYEAALDAEALDLDALGVDRLLKDAAAGSGSDVLLSLDAKALTLAGVRMSGVSIDGALDAGSLDLKRLEIRDAGGAALSGAGRIATGGGGPQGHVSFDVAAGRLSPLLTLARAAGAPEPVVSALQARAGALAPLKLKVDLQAGDAGGKLVANGELAGGRLDASIATQELSFEAPAEVDVRIASADGARLAALVGLGVSPAVATPGGEISLKASGALAKGMSGEARFSALGVDLSGKGALALAPVVGLSAEGAATLKSDDLATFLEAIGRLTPGASPKLPAAFDARLALGPDGLRVDGLDGSLSGMSVKGALTAPYDLSKPFGGSLAFEQLPAAALAGLALSPAAQGGTDGRSAWSAAPFGPAVTRGLAGRFDISAARMPLAGGQTGTEARFVLALRPSGLAVEDFVGRLDGGRLTGSANVGRTTEDATVALAFLLEGVAAERIAGLPPEASPAAGSLDLKLEAQATGRSPSAVMGAFTGAGGVTFRNAKIRRLDVGAIDRIEPEVEAGLALEASRIAAALDRELGAGDLSFDQTVVPFTLSNGVVRTGALSVENAAAKLGGAAALDIRRLTLDADLTLQPKRPDAPQIGVSFEGPLASPKRRIDATAFTGWLSVRAVERETRRIEAMEADIRERARIARLRAEEERRKAEEEKRRLDEERRRAEAERRKREAEVRALTESQPKPAPPTGLPAALNITPPGVVVAPVRPISPPGGVFAPQERGTGTRPTPDAPQSILPPGIGAGR